MIIPKLYNNITTTKTNSLIPVFISGKTMESKYNPEREAENLLNTIDKDFSFFLIFGLGSGLFASKLSEKFNNASVLIVENTQEDLKFLSQFEKVQTLSQNSKITLCTINELVDSLQKEYVPALHGNLKIIETLSWKNENNEIYPYIKEQLNQALSLISSDFSVQSHFGKQWQHNILTNLNKLNKSECSFNLRTNKNTAIIVAAGPSLDSKISYIKENLNNFYIISTDTAFSVLLKNNIEPDIVVSIDGQFISTQHFIHDIEKLNTTFLLDLNSNTSIQTNLKKVIFFNSGHPLSSLACNYSDFPTLSAGAGTVTIAALDFANLMAFSEVQIIAADFSYINGKPYAKGTYLDKIYGNSQSKINTVEQLFSKLMFRTDLIQIDDHKFTTQVLESYRTSFEDYVYSKNYALKKENDIYFLINKNKKSVGIKIDQNFNFELFCNEIIKLVESKNYTVFLPYISYLRTRKSEANFQDLVNLAYSNFVLYNKFI